MIKIRCGGCGQVIVADDKYAGKRVQCPKCRAGVDIPQAGAQARAGQASIIKFRCPHCNQKIGLPAAYAGKQVKCAKCKNPLKVPGAAAPSGPTTVAQKENKPQTASKMGADDFNPFAAMPNFNELLQSKPAGGTGESPLRLAPEGEPAQGSEFTDMSGRIPATAAAESGGGSRGGKSGVIIDNTGVALLASVVFVIIGGMAWGLVAKYIHRELGLLAWGIGVLAGLGIALFTTRRGTLIGIVAALIAFFGILSGKYFIAKWYYMPELMAEIQKEDTKSFVDPNKAVLSSEDIKTIMNMEADMYGIVALQLADEGAITKEEADYFIAQRVAGTLKDDEQNSQDEPNEALQLRRNEVEKKIDGCYTTWDDQKREQAIRVQYSKLMKKVPKEAEESPVMNVVGFAIAYIASFSFFDLIWFPLAMATAFKIGTAESS